MPPLKTDDDRILQLVSKITDEVTQEQVDRDKLWARIRDFVGNLANFIQVVSWVVPAISTVVDLLKTFGNSKDNVDIVQRLQTEFDRVVSEIHEDIEMLHIAEIIAEAQTGLENIQDSPKLPPKTFAPDDDLLRVTDAKNKLTLREFWTRPFIPGAVFTVPRDTTIVTWFSATPPREADHPDRVFDPSLAWPALLTAIQIYSAATTALAGIDGGGSLPQPWKDHLNELAAALDSFHKEIARGIVDLRVPTFDQVTPLPDKFFPIDRSVFETVGDVPGPFGAAFLYSDRHVVDVYPLIEDFPDLSTDINMGKTKIPLRHIEKEQYALFLGRFKLGNMARRKALYILLNLHETWETIQHLRTLAQTTPELVDPFYGWRVSEIAKALEESFPPDPNQPPQFKFVSLSDVMRKLRNLVVPPITDNLGLRGLLTRVTP
jgi:hypothetical protein